MGLMDFISPALTTATQAAGAYQGAQANAAVTQRDAQLNALMMLRQQKQFEMEQALKGAEIGKTTAETRHQNMVNDVGAAGIEGSPENAAWRVGVAGGSAGAEAAAKQPWEIQLEQLKNDLAQRREAMLAQLSHTYRGQEISQEGGIRQNLQTNQQTFDRSMIPARANAELWTKERGSLFGAGLTPTGIALQHAGKLPQVDAADPYTSTGGASLPGVNPRADAWEAYRAQGMTPEQATAKVTADFGGAP